MLTSLKTLQKFTVKNDMTPLLGCIKIDHGQCTASNLSVSMSVFIPALLTIKCAVDAEKFVKALSACAVTPLITVNKGVMLVKAGNFKVNIPVLDVAEFPSIIPSINEKTPLDESFLTTLKTLQAFMGDATVKLPIIQSIQIAGGAANTINKVVLASMPCSEFSSPLVIPDNAVKLLLGAGIQAGSLAIDKSSITIFMNETDYFQCSLLAGDYPDLSAMLNKADFYACQPVTEELRAALKLVAGFSEGEFKRLEMNETGLVSGYSEYQIDGLPVSAWNAGKLLSVVEVATHIDFTKYPGPCPWYGDNGLRGVIVGLKS